MRVKCLAQEHNTMSPARARTQRASSGIERANHEATAPPTKRLIGTRLINKKEPILPDMIKKLDEASKLNNLLYLRNVCIFLLAFAGFSELRKFFTLSMVILFFTTLMLLSKLIEVRRIN